MDKYYKWKVLLIVAVTGFSIWSAYPPQEKINLGLDLQGGMQLLLRVDHTKIPQKGREDATDRVVEIIRNRIDELGVREPVITKQGKEQVVVQLPGITDRERAKEIVGKTAHLEFKLVVDDEKIIKDALAGTVAEGFEVKQIQEDGRLADTLVLESKPVLTGDKLTNASVGFDNYGQATVEIQFDKEGAKVFDSVTFQNIGRRLAIVLDGKVYSAPVIRDRIPSGQGQISGNFTAEQASDLALVLRAGALPAPVEIVEERTIGPSLGRDSIEKGLKAGIASAIFIFVFLPAYFLLAGLIADIGLIVYVILVVGTLALLQSSLTLPGIAGFILSMGMAVDANVLISERMREELKAGKPTRAAISAGYHKAFSAILDSNITIFITALILFYMGTGPVKGFAITLGIGQIASMFSSLTVTRVIFDFLVSRNRDLNLKMLQFFGMTNIRFLKGRFLAYGFSLMTLALGVSSFVLKGQENFGVEFTGGTFVQIKFSAPIEMTKLRAMIESSAVKGAVLQHFGEESDNQFVIRTSEPDTKRIEEAMRKLGDTNQFEILRVDQIGPSVSGDLRKKALWAIFWSCLGILVYLGWRFEWKFALAAVVALIHDTLFTFGIYALSGREINLPIVAAILTIIGYSVNDTIVIFDRVRDNLKIMRKVPFAQVVETSLNQTLSRTILTSFLVLLSTLALFLFGGSGINDFAFYLLIGFSVGIYSTIFVASALVVDWKAH